MLKRNRRKQILAAVLSAAICVGGYTIGEAYTYNGGTAITSDKVTEDENELIITSGANVSITKDLNPQKVKNSIQTVQNIINVNTQKYTSSGYVRLELTGMPTQIPDTVANEILTALKNVKDTYNGNGTLTDINKKYNLNIKYDFYRAIDNCPDESCWTTLADFIGMADFKYNGTEWTSSLPEGNGGGGGWAGVYSISAEKDGSATLDLGTKDIVTVTNLGDAAITVENGSLLSSNGSVQTSRAITISDISELSAKGKIVGGNIIVNDQSRLVAVDSIFTSANSINGDSIVAYGNILAGAQIDITPDGFLDGYSVVSTNIIAKGLLKTEAGGIGAQIGSISAGTIESAGRIIAYTQDGVSGSITAGGKLKSNGLTIGKMNASSASIHGDLAFSKITNLNGGASANSKKISSVGKGMVSNDLINLGQLNSAFAGATGKTYTAGGNITINSSNNTISVVKNGAVKSGDTGIVTGATVFDITSDLESSLTLQNTRLTNLSSSIQSKDTSFGSINTSVSGLQSNVNSAVSSLNTKAQSYLRNDFLNISDEGKTRLSNLITSSIKNYKDNLTGVATTRSDDTFNNQIATLENRTPPTVSARDSGVGNTVGTGAIEQGNTVAVTGGDIYTALDTKVDKDTVNSMLNEKVSVSEFAPVKDSVNWNKADIAGLKDSKADVSSFNTSLEGKVDKSDFDALHSQTMVNREDISSLISSKLNMDGSNLDASAYSTKLANGILEKQNKGLVTGGMVYDALRFTADKDYVDAIDEGLNHTLQETTNSLNKDMNKMAAGAAALAGLHPQDFMEDSKVDFAAGYGHYKDANAVAVGLYYHPNPIATVSLSGTMGNGSPLVNAGLSFKIGYGKHVEKAVVNKADYEALQDQVVKLKQMVHTLSE